MDQFQIGQKIKVNDLADTPHGTWIIPEKNLLIRAENGKSLTSVITLGDRNYPQQKSSDSFDIIYVGEPNINKSHAIRNCLNCL